MEEALKLQKIAEIAALKGDKVAEVRARQQIAKLSEPFQNKNQVDTAKAGRRAAANVRVDQGPANNVHPTFQPLVDFGTEAIRKTFNAINPGQSLDKEQFKDVDLGASLAFTGRGFDNLVKGGKQISIGIREGVLGLPKEVADAERAAIHNERLQENSAYEPLKSQSPALATLGEIVGETAPFALLPIPRTGKAAGATLSAAKKAAEKGENLFDLVGGPDSVPRLFPEAVAAGSEAALPYVEEGESRAGNALAGAAGGVFAQKATDVVSKLANARAGRLANEDHEALLIDAEAENIPVNRGTIEEQAQAARDAADRPRPSEPDYNETVANDIADRLASNKNSAKSTYDAIWDQADGSVRTKNSGEGQSFQTTARDPSHSTKAIKDDIEELKFIEEEKGGLRNRELIEEYDRWLSGPEEVSLEDLHKFRSDLRKRTRQVAKDTGSDVLKFSELEKTISNRMADIAEEAQPGLGQSVRDADDWYYNNIVKFQENPKIAKAIDNKDPSPKAVTNWLLGGDASEVNKLKIETYDKLSDRGKFAIEESIWDDAYKQAGGDNFSPARYSKYAKSKIHTLRKLGATDAADRLEKLGKIMQHISETGKASDSSLLNTIRGVPFIYRSVVEQSRKSNFVNRLSQVSTDIRPGSPKMETFYRGIIRGLAINQPESGSALFDTVSENIAQPAVEAVSQGRESVNRFFGSGSGEETPVSGNSTGRLGSSN